MHYFHVKNEKELKSYFAYMKTFVVVYGLWWYMVDTGIFSTFILFWLRLS